MSYKISPWQPEQRKAYLAALGKLTEECSECAARAARCIIQGIDEIDPDKGKPNGVLLEEEMSDVRATMAFIATVAGRHVSMPRVLDKNSGFNRWLTMLPPETNGDLFTDPREPLDSATQRDTLPL